ncbi:MAG: sigma-70 family RNA polymerase sigma factor [Chthonomonas sp.]|nr:sigma-70 family RNA polymerase sigma factor [Chthonomonas sp.]
MESSQFELMVEEHKDAVYRQMTRVCNGREDAEDALATAIMLAFQSLHQLKDEGAFRGWLAMIGRRVCSRMRQHPKMQEVWEYADAHQLIDRDAEPFEMEVLKGCVKQAVEELDESYRQVYEACEIEEHSLADAAKQLGITEAAAKSRLHRARAMVRDRLDHSICAR